VSSSQPPVMRPVAHGCSFDEGLLVTTPRRHNPHHDWGSTGWNLRLNVPPRLIGRVVDHEVPVVLHDHVGPRMALRPRGKIHVSRVGAVENEVAIALLQA
jgi:hypothetical protein